MGTKKKGLLVLGVKLFLHQVCPESTTGTHFGDFDKKVHANGPEKGETRGKLVDIEASVNARAAVLETIGNGKGQFELGIRTGFLHVVTRDGNGVVAGHVLRRVGEDV